jgi:hypothetical protein
LLVLIELYWAVGGVAGLGAGVADGADGEAGVMGERCGVLIGGDEVPVLIVFSAVRMVPGLK